MRNIYKSKGIQYVRSPVNDLYNDNSYSTDLFEATKLLNDLVDNQKLRVFVHCNQGFTRTPTLALVYICLTEPFQQKDPALVAKLIQDQFPQSHINIPQGNKTIREN